MNKCIIQLGTLFLFVFVNHNSFATHIGGGNISYSCTGNPNEYLVTLSMYRDCNSLVVFSDNPEISFTNFCGLTNPANLILTIIDTLTQEVSQVCDASIGLTTCNGGVLPGYEQYIYSGLITFSAPCDSWNLEYELYNRNTSTNVVGEPLFHITASIFSVTDPCNTSPVIVTDTPIPYFCVNQPVSYDFGVVDVDGDELQFSFVNALGAGGGNILYQAGFSSAQPIAGISINPSTGLVTFLPTLQGNFVVAILITELNVAGNVVGTLIHDMQFVVENCSNQVVLSPSAANNFSNLGTGATFTGGNTISMCNGDQFCLDIVFTDGNVSDVLTLSTNALDVLPGATFMQTGTNPATGTLCWTYTDGYTGNFISINASDNVCPIISNASFIINLDIPLPLNVSADVNICGNIVANLEAYGTAPVVWSVISGDPLLVGANFTCNPCSSPAASPSVTTVYEVVDGSNCNLTDQVTVSVLPSIGGISTTIVTPDTVLCYGDCFNVNAIAEEIFSAVTPISNSASTQLSINDYSTVTSFINVFGLNMTTIGVGSIQSVCLDIDHDFVADLDIYLVSPAPNNTQFLLSSDNGGFGDDYDNTCFTIDATTLITLGTAPFLGNYIPEGGPLSDALIGSPANGSWSLEVTDDSGGNVGILNSWTLVLNDDIPNYGSATTVLWTSGSIDVTEGINDPTDLMTEICGVASGLYTLTAYDVNNCSVAADFNITILSSGNSGLDSSITICKENVMIDLFSFLGGTPDAGGVWMNANGDTISGLILPDTIVNGSVFEYEVFGINCSVSSFVTVSTFELTQTHVFVNSDCQVSNGSITITVLGNLGPITYSSDNGTTTQASNVFDNLLPATYTILVEDSLGCQTTFTQTILDINLPVISSLSVVDNSCNTGTEGEIQVNGNNLNFYSINGGVTIQTSNVFIGLPAGSYLIIAYSSDPLTTTACSTISNVIIEEPSPLDVYDITAPLMACPGDEVILTANNHGGMGNAILTWVDGQGNVLGTGNSIIINPIVNTVVTVEMNEGACPTDSETTLVSIPTPIYPAMSSNTTSGCFSLNVKFVNLSTNATEIATTNWSFSANSTIDVIGVSSVTAIYDQVGVFDLTMSVTSIYGCVYSAIYANYIVVYDDPVANFSYTPNWPIMNAPDVVLTSTSSNDVVQWDWSMDNGTPTSASTESVNVTFPQGVPGIYPVVLKVWNEFSCIDSAVLQIEVIDDATTIYAPNTFTPNGDAYNETWKVFISGIDKDQYHMVMYNRRGEIAWESYDPEGEWDGKFNSTGKVVSGTYVWVANTVGSQNGKEYKFRGTVTISR